MMIIPKVGQTWEWSNKSFGPSYPSILFTLIEEKVHGDARRWWLALNHDTQNIEMIVFSMPNTRDWTFVQ